MKRILLMLSLVLIFSSVSYGAVSQDIYVRQDVFDAKMEALFERLHGEIVVLSERMEKNFVTLSERIDKNFVTLSERIDKNFATLSERIDKNYATLSERIDGNYVALSERMDGNYASLSRRIDGLEKRVEDTNTFLYYLLVLFGAMLILPFVSKWLDSKKEVLKKEPSFTLDDVKQLIANAIAEAQLSGKIQV